MRTVEEIKADYQNLENVQDEINTVFDKKKKILFDELIATQLKLELCTNSTETDMLQK